MQLGNSFSVRLSLDTEAIMRSAADVAGISFGVFIRRRIEQMLPLEEELAALRAAIELLDLQDPRSSEAASSVEIETLLLLRQMASPTQLRAVQADMERLGVELWRGAASHA